MKVSYEIKELPTWNVAAVRHVGPYAGIGMAFERLYAWAAARGLLRFPETQAFAVYRDDPATTPPAELRSDACITVPPGTEVDNGVATLEIPGGLFAVGHFELDQSEFGAAWAALAHEYIPSTGYVPDDRICYEWYLNDPDQHPDRKFIVDICEPVRAAD